MVGILQFCSDGETFWNRGVEKRQPSCKESLVMMKFRESRALGTCRVSFHWGFVIFCLFFWWWWWWCLNVAVVAGSLNTESRMVQLSHQGAVLVQWQGNAGGKHGETTETILTFLEVVVDGFGALRCLVCLSQRMYLEWFVTMLFLCCSVLYRQSLSRAVIGVAV